MTHSGWHVALVAVALMVSSSRLLEIPVDEMLLVASAAGAFLVYVLDRGWGREEDAVNHPNREGWWMARGRMRWVGVVTLGLVALWAGLHVPGRVLTAGLGLGLVGVAYAGPWDRWVGRGKSGSWSLKWKSGRARWVLIAVVWGGAVVLLPALAANGVAPGATGWIPVVLLAAYRSAWLLPNTLAAEFHGRAGDRSAGMRNVTDRWSRSTLTGWTWGAAVLTGGLLVALMVIQPVAVRWVLALDFVGVLAVSLYIGKIGIVTGSTIFILDLMAVWPLIPALLVGAI